MYSNRKILNLALKREVSSTCYKWKTTVKYRRQGREGMSPLPALEELSSGTPSVRAAALQAALTGNSGSTSGNRGLTSSALVKGVSCVSLSDSLFCPPSPSLFNYIWDNQKTKRTV